MSFYALCHDFGLNYLRIKSFNKVILGEFDRQNRFVKMNAFCVLYRVIVI